MASTPVPDHTITRRIAAQLTNRGLKAPCKIGVDTHRGEVTLSGTIQHAFQRQTAMIAVRSVEGVKHVIDQLKILAPVPRD